MIRNTCRMAVNAGAEAEYERRHNDAREAPMTRRVATVAVMLATVVVTLPAAAPDPHVSVLRVTLRPQ